MEEVRRPRHDRAERTVGRAEAGEPRRDADVRAPAPARLATAARVGRVGDDALTGPWPVGDDATELVAEHQRPSQAGVADGALAIPMSVRAAQPDRRDPDQDLAPSGRRDCLARDPDVAWGVEPRDVGDLDGRGGRHRRCP